MAYNPDDGSYHAHIYNAAEVHTCVAVICFSVLLSVFPAFLLLSLASSRSNRGSPTLLGVFESAGEAASAWCDAFS